MRRPPPRNSFRFWLLTVRADVRCYKRRWWKEPGFWALFSHRVRRLRKTSSLLVALPTLPLDMALSLARMVVARCELPWQARIGPGLFLPHPNGVIVSPQARIGSRVSLFQQVTLGYWNGGAPHLRSRCCIFAGAKLIGGVEIGRRCFVGANAVVTKSVPAWHVASGVPAVTRPRSDVLSAGPAQPADLEAIAANLF